MKLCFAVCLIQAALALPLGKKESEDRVLYDQRQEGEWNVRADLKNFVILIIPAQTSPQASLLDLLTKSLPKRNEVRKSKPKPGQETLHFIESKTAPYHVDISKSKNHLAKLHPEVIKNEEVLLANSPTVALVKNGRLHRGVKEVVLTVLPENELVLTKSEEEKKVIKKDVKKKLEISKEPLLLGAENEQCGPGLHRDSKGNCAV